MDAKIFPSHFMPQKLEACFSKVPVTSRALKAVLWSFKMGVSKLLKILQ